MSLTIEGLEEILDDYLKYNGKYCKRFTHNVEGSNIHIVLRYSNDSDELMHIDMTTLLIYANERIIKDRVRIDYLEQTLEYIKDDVDYLMNKDRY